MGDSCGGYKASCRNGARSLLDFLFGDRLWLTTTSWPQCCSTYCCIWTLYQNSWTGFRGTSTIFWNCYTWFHSDLLFLLVDERDGVIDLVSRVSMFCIWSVQWLSFPSVMLGRWALTLICSARTWLLSLDLPTFYNGLFNSWWLLQSAQPTRHFTVHGSWTIHIFNPLFPSKAISSRNLLLLFTQAGLTKLNLPDCSWLV